jgi:hypothetical protein
VFVASFRVLSVKSSKDADSELNPSALGFLRTDGGDPQANQELRTQTSQSEQNMTPHSTSFSQHPTTAPLVVSPTHGFGAVGRTGLITSATHNNGDNLGRSEQGLALDLRPSQLQPDAFDQQVTRAKAGDLLHALLTNSEDWDADIEPELELDDIFNGRGWQTRPIRSPSPSSASIRIVPPNLQIDSSSDLSRGDTPPPMTPWADPVSMMFITHARLLS